MLAFAWPWGDAARDDYRNISARLGASLCAGIGGDAGTYKVDDIHCAYRGLQATAAQAKAWRPARLPNGKLAIFHGYFDNAASIATELGANRLDLGELYALAVEAWGEHADLKIIGDYCAVIADPGSNQVRLVRSPLRAPPLYHFQDEKLVVAGSVPRIFFAAGAPERLNERRVADSGMINFLDQEASWFEDICRVPLGSIVELRRGELRLLNRYYDPLAVPNVQVANDAECVARVSELLDEAVRACLTGFRKPGATLSGGLDSPQIAVRALAALPAGQKLPTFTFHPGVTTPSSRRRQPGTSARSSRLSRACIPVWTRISRQMKGTAMTTAGMISFY
jgi:asparagine synthase (glutamine-hydrolysing)